MVSRKNIGLLTLSSTVTYYYELLYAFVVQRISRRSTIQYICNFSNLISIHTRTSAAWTKFRMRHRDAFRDPKIKKKFWGGELSDAEGGTLLYTHSHTLDAAVHSLPQAHTSLTWQTVCLQSRRHRVFGLVRAHLTLPNTLNIQRGLNLVNELSAMLARRLGKLECSSCILLVYTRHYRHQYRPKFKLRPSCSNEHSLIPNCCTVLLSL